jgi:hypothetical protein
MFFLSSAMLLLLEEPKKVDLNNYTWIIITAMGGFILTLGGVIAKLYKDLQKCSEERKQFTEDQLNLLRTLRNEFEPKDPRP